MRYRSRQVVLALRNELYVKTQWQSHESDTNTHQQQRVLCCRCTWDMIYAIDVSMWTNKLCKACCHEATTTSNIKNLLSDTESTPLSPSTITTPSHDITTFAPGFSKSHNRSNPRACCQQGREQLTPSSISHSRTTIDAHARRPCVVLRWLHWNQ